ncbi:MAG: hypothetical protein Q7S05_04865 [bacterium]|nr:hypothetical protein [bacterium]
MHSEEGKNISGSAYLVAGGSEMIEPILASLERAGIEARGNPDVHIREYLQFGIDEARELRSRASSRAIKEKGRVFIIVTPQMTNDAQNALLKTLEEPSASASFYIIVPSPETLLPTLRSRAQTLAFEEVEVREGIVDAKEFLRAVPAKRIELLKQLLPKEKETRDVGAIIAFLSALERELGAAGAEKSKEGLEAVYRARKYVTDKGSLLKPLLEQVALLTPRL